MTAAQRKAGHQARSQPTIGEGAAARWRTSSRVGAGRGLRQGSVGDITQLISTYIVDEGEGDCRLVRKELVTTNAKAMGERREERIIEENRISLTASAHSLNNRERMGTLKISGRLLHTVVGGLLGDDDIVNVGFAEAGGGDAHEAALLGQFL